jgi:hypothetical protein
MEEVIVLRRLWPLTGIAFFVAWIAGFALHAGSDGLTSPTAAVSYYAAHQTAISASIMAWTVAALLLVFFAANLQSAAADRGRGEPGPLPGAILGGGVAWSVGILFTALTHDALLHASIDGQTAVAPVALVLANEDFVPTVAGIAILCLAAGVAGFLGAAVPRWLGAVALLIGLLAVAGPLGMYAFLAAPVWILIVAVVELRRAFAGNQRRLPAQPTGAEA